MTGHGRYELLDRIGKGGMAELFRARAVGAEGFSKVVAVKRILPELAGDESFAAMLIDEARVVSNLSHPNIVQVFELGRDAIGYYIAMELVNGPNLSAVLTRLREQGRRLPEPLALEIVIQVLQALDSAHRYTDAAGRPLGIVHRDVSPQNVLISDSGAVKLGDFGIAKASNRVTRETQTGGIKGKIPYMAPEQVRGTGVDGRTDQFACGLVLWECLAGQMHYAGETDMELLWKAGEGRIRPLGETGVEVSPELEALLHRALSTRPEDRYESCGEFARALTVYDRRTYPAHDPAALGNLVRELFGAELKELAERLQRLQAGLEPAAGWAGGVSPIPLVQTVLPGRSALGGGAALGLDDEPLEPTVVRSRVMPDGSDAPAASAVDQPSAAAEEAEAVEAPPKMTAEELAAIEAALAAERSAASPGRAREKVRGKGKGREKRSVLSAPLLLGAFALAAGGAWFGLGALDGPGGMEPLQPAPAVAEPEPEKPAPADPAPSPDPAPAVQPPARAAAPKKGEKAAAGFGTLDVDCTPECSIEIDGRDTGLVGPTRGIVLSAGRHKLRVRNSRINWSKTVTVEVAGGAKLRRSFNAVLDP